MKRVKPISKEHRRWLAKVVETYGVERVLWLVPKVRTQKPGRPSLGDERYENAVHYANCIEASAEEHKSLGHKAPIKQALLDAIREERGVENPDKFLGAARKRLQIGRKFRQLKKQGANWR